MDDQEEYGFLDKMNQFATLSTDSEEIYVPDDIVIGEDEKVNPGIYDLEITGGLAIFSVNEIMPCLCMSIESGERKEMMEEILQ